MEAQIIKIARQASKAARVVAALTTVQKNALLETMALLLLSETARIQRENQIDMDAAAASGTYSAAALDRLMLNSVRIADMAAGVRAVIALPDPVGLVAKEWTRPNGLRVQKVRIPLGVIGMIYESRPNVTVDAAALCLKSGNAIILRGGSEAIRSNTVLGEILQAACSAQGVDPHIIQVVPMTDRAAMQILVQQSQYIDLMIPRGSAQLMHWMAEHSKIPVIKHDKGVCHVYVDREADCAMATEIIVNAKVQRPGVCNAMETLLVHQDIAQKLLPMVWARLEPAGLTVHGCPATRTILAHARPATDQSWDTEYLDLALSCRVVPSTDAALQHIAEHGSHHTEVIVTGNAQTAQHFLHTADASAVMWNASTRFNDGGQLGLGAEIGISTTKIHAFGPMGLEELTTTKFVVKGTGQIRS